VCVVDGSPHKNQSVIIGVPGTSHDSDICIYARIMQCTRNANFELPGDLSFPDFRGAMPENVWDKPGRAEIMWDFCAVTD